MNDFQSFHQDGERPILAQFQIMDIVPLVVGIALDHKGLKAGDGWVVGPAGVETFADWVNILPGISPIPPCSL